MPTDRHASLASLLGDRQAIMAGKGYKNRKRSAARFVQIPEWLQASEAWATLPPGPRALYVELKRRFNGKNNGEIYFSHRDAAAALGVHRNTVGPWFRALEERGFIFMTQAPHLGPAGIGQASVWGLSEAPTLDGKPARKTFLKFKTPAQILCMGVTKNRTPKPQSGPVSAKASQNM